MSRTSKGRCKLSTNTTLQTDGFARDDNSNRARYSHDYTCLQVKLATFFHLDNEPLEQHLNNDISRALT